jgi:ligand-binding sensor domain-containing protein/serine phosphatase RsbU (regulator of sigma subunit)
MASLWSSTSWKASMRTGFLTGAFLFFWGTLPAQIYYFDNYSVSEGLAQSKIFAIIQDRNDYIWLGTEGGVSRFDGVSFENFTSEDGLAINGVRSLFEDTRGVLWFGHTGGGITRFDGRRFEIFRQAATLINSDVTSINQDPEGRVWITTAQNGALYISNPEAASSSEFRYEQFKGGRLSDRVFGMYIARDSTLYFITDIGLQRKSPQSPDFEKFFIQGMGYFQVTSFLEDRKGNLWFGTYNDGLYHFDKGTEKLNFYNTRHGLAHNFVSTLLEDSKGNLWVGTWGGGLTRIRDGKLKTFNQENGLQDLKIWSLLEDVEGNILVGTNENGLSIFKGEQFVSFSEKNGLVNNQVWAVLQDRTGKFWFGTNGGISIYDPGRPAGQDFRHLTGEQYAIGNQIRFLKEDRNGHIWIGTYGNGTYEYDPVSRKFSYSFQINSYNQQLIVTAMDIDRENNLWVGTTDGLIYYNIDHRQVQYLTQVHGLAGTDISALYSDSGGTLWIGSKGKGITTIVGDSIHQLSLDFEFTPNCFAESSDGRVWVGTEGQGIFAIENRKLVGQLSREDGLLANLITLVNVDGENNVFIGTNKGLNKYDISEDRIFTYMEKNGFVGIETKNNASFRDRDGKLWFGTVAGVIRYDPDMEYRSGIDPLTHITRMRVNLEERAMTPGMRLGSTEKSIIFDFNSICLTNPDAVSYQYKLEGADVDWLPQTDQTTATYPALRPGRYVFQVRARNSDGVWNAEPVSFAFQIRPPFYARWWFILICVFLGALAILTYITLRTRKLRRENQILEEKVRLRTAQVVAQKEELAQKNKDITDSIQYARRIQIAILPPEIPFPDTFILFKPKDIVSGDFYWLLEMAGRQYIAAVDCTGHGVPGAFMSIIGHNMLNKVVKEFGIMKPSEILKQLDVEVTKTLHQQVDTVRVLDGMDMTLIAYRKDLNMIEFAGAINPIYLVRGGELIETKGDRFPIGRSALKVNKEFTNHEIPLQKGDTVYMFSDGFADQFGGTKGKKFKIARMKDLILEICEKSMEEQRLILDRTIEAWRGSIEQIDDILIIGRRF